MATSEAAAAPPHASDKKETRAGVLHPPAGPHLPGPAGVRLSMPTGTAGRVLWWGGLAAVAAAGLVDWPVAALIGAGSWVAEQYAKAAREPDGAQQEAS